MDHMFLRGSRHRLCIWLGADTGHACCESYHGHSWRRHEQGELGAGAHPTEKPKIKIIPKRHNQAKIIIFILAP